MKVRFLAVCLASVSALTLAGCKKTTPNNRVATTANWNVRTAAIVETNSNAYWQTHTEVATYSTEFTEGSNQSYSIAYKAPAATYVAKFYMESAYDWTAETLPEDYRKDEGSEPVYVYETEKRIDGTLTIKSSEQSLNFEDSTVTICKFRMAKDRLEPVYSKQIIKNTSPAALNASKLENAYVTTDKTFETFYNKDCTEATVITTNNDGSGEPETKKVSLKCGGYSLFDNCQLGAAIRSFTLTANSNRTFYTLSAQNGATGKLTARVGKPTELNKEVVSEANIIGALTTSMPEDYIFFDGATDGSETPRTMRYTPVTATYGKGANPTYWYATAENTDANATRSLLLRTTTPLAFATGTLTYSLKSLNVEARG